MLRTRWLAFVCLALAILAVPGFLLAQGDTTAAGDKTGIFGPVLDHFWAPIVTLLTSLTVKIIAAANKGFAKTSAPVKWVALYFFALAYNYGAQWLNITTVDPVAPVFALSAVQGIGAALIYRFGQHRVPALEPSPVP